MAQILIVEDCEDQRVLLHQTLGRDHAVSAAEDVPAARDSLATQPPDLIVLDIELPGVDGFGFASEVRQNPLHAEIPIVFLSGRGSTSDKVMAFALGAQDYVEKPFAPAELRARVTARLAESTSRRSDLRFRDLRLDSDRFCVVSESQPGLKVELTTTELRILQTLMRNAGDVVTRESLIADAWNGRVVSARTVDTHIWALRRKLEANEVSVETVRGLGYRLV
ncbi:MAG: response regulator transcription factor [Myxococcota bacterium]